MSAEVLRVGVSDLVVRGAPAQLECLGLGSCVAIIIWDAATRTGAVAHVLLPEPPSARTPAAPGRYARTAVPALVRALRGAGAPGPYVATLVGGASLFGDLLKVRGVAIGTHNVEVAREALAAAGVPVVAEDVGASHARSVRVVLQDGRVAVRTLAHGSRVL